MATIIYVCGFYSLAFALFHIGFWKMFNWNSELKNLSFANKGIMQILNVQLTYFCFFVAFICFAFPSELLTTNLGISFLAGTSLFWFIRTVQQFIFLRANNYKIHILTILFLAGAIIFAIPVFS